MPFTVTLAHFANGLLLLATLLYLIHLWWGSCAQGRRASTLALLGALLLLSSVALAVWRGAAPDSSGLDQVMAMFSAFTVLIYLAMERFYRSYVAGAFVMPIVAASVLVQIWLGMEHSASAQTGHAWLGDIWVHAHVVSNFLGYGAFAVSAALAAMLLASPQIRARLDERAWAFPDIEQLARWARRTVCWGFFLFSLGMLLGMLAAYPAWGGYWIWRPKQSWALLVWLVYGIFLLSKWRSPWSRRSTAWWLLGSFLLTVMGFLGLQLCAHEFRAYG